MKLLHRISMLLLAATTALGSPTLSAHPLPDHDAFLGQPTVANGLYLLAPYRNTNDAGGRVTIDALKEACWRAIQPEDSNVDNMAACLNAAAKLVDPHAWFVHPPSSNSSTPPDASMGVLIKKATDGNGFVINDVIPGSPAAANGIIAGDKVVEVDGQVVAGWTLSELVSKLRGKPDSTVEVALQRDAQRLKVSIQRAHVPLEPISEAPLESSWYVQIREFPERLTDRFRTSLRTASRAGALQHALVLDLRGNRGGYMQEILEFANILAPELKPVMYQLGWNGLNAVRANRHRPDEGEDADIRRRLKDLPLVLLVDQNTGSGAEWLAAVLRQRRGTWILGQRTAGVTEVSKALDLADFGWFNMPVGTIFPGRGMPIDGYGVVPDEERPVEPLRLAVPPDWLPAWLKAETYRKRPPQPSSAPAATEESTPTVCLGDMQLPGTWANEFASAPNRNLAVRFGGSSGEFSVSVSDLLPPDDLAFMWGRFQDTVASSRQAISQHIVELEHRRDESQVTKRRVDELRHRLRDVGLHPLAHPSATLVVAEEKDLVVWIHDQRLYKLSESAHWRAPLSSRMEVYAAFIDRIVLMGKATGAMPGVCLLDGSLALKDGETITGWTFNARWKAGDAQLFLKMNNQTSEDEGTSHGLPANVEKAAAFDRLLLLDDDTYRCSPEHNAARQIVEAASFAGEPAVLRATSIDNAGTPDRYTKPTNCRTVRVINRVPLDETVHWHRFIHLFTTSTDAAFAEAQLRRWMHDFNAVARETLTHRAGQ